MSVSYCTVDFEIVLHVQYCTICQGGIEVKNINLQMGPGLHTQIGVTDCFIVRCVYAMCRVAWYTDIYVLHLHIWYMCVMHVLYVCGVYCVYFRLYIIDRDKWCTYSTYMVCMVRHMYCCMLMVCVKCLGHTYMQGCVIHFLLYVCVVDYRQVCVI